MRCLHTLKIYYKDKLAEQQILDEFQSEYCSERAIWWYTRPTVTYRLLNKALRQHNIELTFLFGSFIQDLYRQLKEQSVKFESKNTEKKEIIFNVYREQVMSSVEIQNLLRTNQWAVTDIVNNSFLSTSIDRSISLSFLYSSEILDSLERVLFEIVVDRRCLAPLYAGISQVSYYPNELEILFMIGTLFKLKKNGMKYDENEKILEYQNYS